VNESSEADGENGVHTETRSERRRNGGDHGIVASAPRLARVTGREAQKHAVRTMHQRFASVPPTLSLCRPKAGTCWRLIVLASVSSPMLRCSV